MAESNQAESTEIYSDMVRAMTDQELALILALSMTSAEVDDALGITEAPNDV